MNTIKRIQQEVGRWSEKNFGDQESWKPLLGIGEEVGELNHAHLKESQGIRTNENHVNNKVDALGDLFIYMCDYADKEGIDLNVAIISTWEKVKQRDWKANKRNGK